MNSTLKIIKMAKNTQKMTNEELSRLSGVPFGTVNKILSGATKSIKSETLQKLYLALNISNSEVVLPENGGLSHGFCKVGAYTPEIVLGSPLENSNRIVDGIIKASELGVNLLVFPKLCLTGSTLGSLFYQPTLLTSALSGLSNILDKTRDLPIVSVVGLPLLVEGKIYSGGAVISRGKILGVVPENDYQSKVFAINDGVESISLLGEEVAFGSLVFYAENQPELSFVVEFASDLYSVSNPSSVYGSQVAISLCMSSTCELVGKEERLKTLISAQSSKFSLGYVLAEAGYGESTTDCVYSGKNYIYENGELLSESKRFTSGLIVSEIDVEFLAYEKAVKKLPLVSDLVKIPFSLPKTKFSLTRSYKKLPFINKNASLMQERAELILDIQANGLKRRIEHVHAKSLVIGVSGGLDSTLALLVAVRAMKLAGKSEKDVYAVTMPCFGTTNRTKNNAYDMCKALGVTLKEINIKKAVTQHFEDIGQSVDVHDVTFENSQARERTQVLMDFANKTGGLVVGTGDLSELALGWATYNGDHMSNYSVNATIPKTLVRHLVLHESSRYGESLKKTLLDVLDTPVSPELVPPKQGEITQKTEDIVGPYILHDFYLYHVIRRRSNPKKIFYIAKNVFKKEYTPQTLYKWLENFYRRFFAQQFKRSCVPDGVKVGVVSLSPRGDFDMPSDAYSTVWLKELEEIEV